MARIIDWKQTEDPRDIVHVAVQALAEGELIALPTESTYQLVASGLKRASVERLVQFSGNATHARRTLFIRGMSELKDYAPDLPVIAERIGRRAWPGPVTLQIPCQHPDSLVRQLPVEAKRFWVGEQNNEVNFRVTAHSGIGSILRLCAGPLVGLELEQPTGEVVTQGKMAASVSGKVAAVCLDDGTTHFQQPAGLIQVNGNACRLLDSRFLNLTAAQSLSQMIILIVCTGNTCRSPMAQVLLQKRLQDKFAERFAGQAVAPAVALSAGTSAGSGSSASPEAITAMSRRGLDLKSHQSRSVTARMIEQADLVLTMTQNHRQTLLSRWPQFENKVSLLATDGLDVSDPYGGPQEVYWAASQQIDAQLAKWVERIDERLLPNWS